MSLNRGSLFGIEENALLELMVDCENSDGDDADVDVDDVDDVDDVGVEVDIVDVDADKSEVEASITISCDARYCSITLLISSIAMNHPSN